MLCCAWLLFLLVLWAVRSDDPSACEVTWDTIVRALVVTDSPANAAPDAGFLLLLQWLRSPRLQVEVVVARPGMFQEHCQVQNLTVRLVYATHPRMHQEEFTGFLRKLQRRQHYELVVWIVTDHHSLLTALTFPGSRCFLWVRAPPRTFLPSRGFPFQEILRFEAVWFENVATLTKCARLINPLGHLPPTFQLFSSQEDFQLRVEALVRQLPGYSSLQKKDSPPSHSTPAITTLPPVPHKKRCPHRHRAKLAVVMHFGNHSPDHTMILFRALPHMPNSTDLWVTYVDPAGLAFMAQRGRLRSPAIHPLGVTERGRHLGPFFTVLWHMAICGYKYEYLLKLHLLPNNEPNGNTPITLSALERPAWLPPLLQHLDTSASVVAMYPKPFRGLDAKFYKGTMQYDWDNHHYMKQLSERLNVTWVDHVVLSSVWISRTTALRPLLQNATFVLEELAALAEADGLDWNWYNFVYLSNECSQEFVEQHFLHTSVPFNIAGNPHNKNVSIKKTLEGSRSSGWERVFTFLFSNAGTFDSFSLIPPVDDD